MPEEVAGTISERCCEVEQGTFSPVSSSSSVDDFFTFHTVAKWSVRFPNAATRAPSRLKATSVYRRSVPPRRVPRNTIPG